MHLSVTHRPPLSLLWVGVAASLIISGCATPINEWTLGVRNSLSDSTNSAKTDSLDRIFAETVRAGGDQCANPSYNRARQALINHRQLSHQEVATNILEWSMESARSAVHTFRANTLLCTQPNRTSEKELLRVADRDLDGLSDWSEINEYHTDPMSADSDKGGVADGLEILIANTDPKQATDDADEIKRYPSAVLFPSDSNTIEGQVSIQLHDIAEKMWQLPQLKLHIEGHTDNNASLNENIELSHQRALHLVKIMVDQYAVTPDRVIAEGYGPYHPATMSNETPNERNYLNLVLKVTPATP